MYTYFPVINNTIIYEVMLYSDLYNLFCSQSNLRIYKKKHKFLFFSTASHYRLFNFYLRSRFKIFGQN